MKKKSYILQKVFTVCHINENGNPVNMFEDYNDDFELWGYDTKTAAENAIKDFAKKYNGFPTNEELVIIESFYCDKED